MGLLVFALVICLGIMDLAERSQMRTRLQHADPCRYWIPSRLAGTVLMWAWMICWAHIFGVLAWVVTLLFTLADAGDIVLLVVAHRRGDHDDDDDGPPPRRRVLVWRRAAAAFHACHSFARST
jgi:hypothetical protein